MATRTPDDAAPRPLPDLDNPLYAEHFRMLRAGTLAVRICTSCSSRQWPPHELCGVCHGGDFTWDALPDTGVVYTFTVTRRAYHPWFASKTPYATVAADVDGVRYTAPLFGPAAEDVRCGAEVRLEFDIVDDDIALPRWVLV